MSGIAAGTESGLCRIAAIIVASLLLVPTKVVEVRSGKVVEDMAH